MRAAALFEILQDAAIELQDVGVALHGHERAGLLTTDAAGAEHHDRLSLELRRKFLHRGGEVSEIPDLRHDRPLERPHPDLVVVPGVEQGHRPAFVQPLLELRRRDLGRRTAGRIDAFDAEGDDLLLDLHQHALERLLGTRAFLGLDAREARHGADHGQDDRKLLAGAGQEEVDALRREQDRPLESVGLGAFLQAETQLLQAFERRELIAGEIDDLGGHDAG